MKRRSKLRCLRPLLVVGLILAAPAPSTAHGGGLDANGCHRDSSTGEVHCHRKPAKAETKGNRSSASPKEPRRVLAYVLHVVDGDTLKVVVGRDQKVTVRLKGIDCPESRVNAKCKRDGDCSEDVPKGKDATQAMRSLVLAEKVWLVAAGKGGDFEFDDYGRTLSYVELDGVDVGLQLVRRGICDDYSRRYPHPRQTLYRAAARSR